MRILLYRQTTRILGFSFAFLGLWQSLHLGFLFLWVTSLSKFLLCVLVFFSLFLFILEARQHANFLCVCKLISTYEWWTYLLVLFSFQYIRVNHISFNIGANFHYYSRETDRIHICRTASYWIFFF